MTRIEENTIIRKVASATSRSYSTLEQVLVPGVCMRFSPLLVLIGGDNEGYDR